MKFDFRRLLLCSCGCLFSTWGKYSGKDGHAYNFMQCLQRSVRPFSVSLFPLVKEVDSVKSKMLVVDCQNSN